MSQPATPNPEHAVHSPPPQPDAFNIVMVQQFLIMRSPRPLGEKNTLTLAINMKNKYELL